MPHSTAASPLAAGAPAPPLPAAVLAERRERFHRALDGAAALLVAPPEQYRSRDTEIPYRAGSDLLYLTGFAEPETVALFHPTDPEHRFTLFVRPRDPEREAWAGRRAGIEGARERFGADAAYPIAELPERLAQLLGGVERLAYSLGASPEVDALVLSLLATARRTRPRTGVGLTTVLDPEWILAALRLRKEPEELARMRVAAEIARIGHGAAREAARDGAGEWEVQAALEAAFRAAGASGPAFPSIVASGPNATVLHYTSNDRRMRAGELLLVDAGAEWGGYCSDITRTWAVGGTLEGERRAVHELVREAERVGIESVRPGASVASVHDAVVRVLTRGMIELGLLQGEVDALIEEGAHKRFYLHQTSHWLGLDVHDVGLYRTSEGPLPLEPGMVLTVEPGLYIPADAEEVPEGFRGIGVRIEDDVLVTSAGHEVLTDGLTTEP